MNFKELLKLADEMVFAKTGNHLDDLEEAILQGTLQRDTYKKIAKDFDCSESRVREVGSQLWRILSDELGEDVSKTNFGSTMRRFIFANASHFSKEVVAIGSFEKEVVAISSFNICRENINPPNYQISNSQTSYKDLSEMPHLRSFYDRTSELETLKTWILEQHCHLISLTGISGIGKTTLAVQLVQKIKDKFEYVIWRSLETSLKLTEFQEEFSQLLLQSKNQDLSPTNQKQLPLIKYLQNSRCLVVLDDVHHLFRSGELAGKYKPDCEDYHHLFKQVEKLSHHSCFLLIGWEQPREVLAFKSQNTPICHLQLTGLDATSAEKILRDNRLAEIENCSAFIDRYQGNPLWLNSVASLIQELGGGLTELLPDDMILLPEDMKDSLQQQCDRLSELEKQVISLLAKETEPITLAQLLEKGTIPTLDLLNALQSLSRRCLGDRQESFYTLSPIVRQYVASHI